MRVHDVKSGKVNQHQCLMLHFALPGHRVWKAGRPTCAGQTLSLFQTLVSSSHNNGYILICHQHNEVEALNQSYFSVPAALRPR